MTFNDWLEEVWDLKEPVQYDKYDYMFTEPELIDYLKEAYMAGYKEAKQEDKEYDG
jgi:hypothetical protein